MQIYNIKKLADNYLERSRSIPLLRWREGYVPVLLELKKNLKDELKNKKILDYGCGPGTITALFKKAYSFDFYGVDISKRMIEIAQTNNGSKKFSLLEKQKYVPFHDNLFDACMSTWSFVAISSEESVTLAIKEIFRTLKPSGFFCMIINNEDLLGEETTLQINGTKKKYKLGEEIKVTLKSDQIAPAIQIKDYYWPKQFLMQKMQKIGFVNIHNYIPIFNEQVDSEMTYLQKKHIIKDGDYKAFSNEKTHVIVTSQKPFSQQTK